MRTSNGNASKVEQGLYGTYPGPNGALAPTPAALCTAKPTQATALPWLAAPLLPATTMRTALLQRAIGGGAKSLLAEPSKGEALQSLCAL